MSSVADFFTYNSILAIKCVSSNYDNHTRCQRHSVSITNNLTPPGYVVVSAYSTYLRSLVPFRNQTPLKTKCCIFYPPVKVREGMGDISKSVCGRIIHAPSACFRFPLRCPVFNQSTSNATVVKTQTKFCTFWP